MSGELEPLVEVVMLAAIPVGIAYCGVDISYLVRARRPDAYSLFPRLLAGLFLLAFGVTGILLQCCHMVLWGLRVLVDHGGIPIRSQH